MAHTLLRLTSQVFNKPQLITEAEFAPIVKYLKDRNTLANPIYQGTPGKGLDTEELDIFNGVGVLQISGPLVYKPVDTMCGEELTSYLDLIEDTQELCNAGVKAIIYEVSSGGGAASHAFETANSLKEILAENGVASFAYIDEISASAAYALSCVFDEIIINPSASAGSIGAVVCLMDDSKAMEQAGLKEIYITSTPGKVPFAADGSFKESFLTKLQEDVKSLGLEFAQHVSDNTGLSVEEILAMDAQCYNAEMALEKGLVNSIMNHKEFSAYIAGKYN